ncbi:tetratricopeptide repeat protein [Kitasatospora sp. NPDC004615]|uniref:tetratricopeptide repeat protein n=1 Tax=Kitasatospora sp. NPDC004615 TaxID=3364017 RepID=UPI00369D45FA
MEPVVEVRFISRLQLIYPPSSATGPRPITAQVSGHGIAVRVSAPEAEPVVVHTLGFRVKSRHPTRTAPLEIDPWGSIPDPQVRVWLDEPAQMADGPVPITLPTTIPHGQSEWFLLTAHTQEHDVEWELGIEWSCGEKKAWTSCNVRTTAETSMVTFRKDGSRTPGFNLHPQPDRPEIAAAAEAGYRPDAENGDPEAMFRLAVRLAERGALREAKHWFLICATMGNATAAESVGWILEQQGKHAESVDWYRKAADLGSTRAAERLAERPAGEEPR